MESNDYLFCRVSNYDLERTEENVLAEVEKYGFRIQAVHDVQKTFAEKGKNIEFLKIIEICNVKYASQALGENKLISLMMPCKVNIIVDQEQIKVCTFKASALAAFFPDADLDNLARELDDMLVAIVNQASGN